MKYTSDGAQGSDWWIKSANLTFSEILVQSVIPEKWSRYDLVQKYVVGDIIKPVNKYVFSLYPKPELINISKNIAQLRQKTHAEIWVKPEKNESLYALDKTWQRQFYPSSNKIQSDNCFKPTYKFYVPWIFYKNCKIKISGIKDAYSPFFILDTEFDNIVPEYNSKYIDTNFVDFNIKNHGDYLVNGRYGIIDVGTPMYDMYIELTKEELKKMETQYDR
jgi:hypothetical protein